MRQSVECRQASAPKQACLYYGNCKDKGLPEFRRIRLEDKSWVDPILKAEGSASSGGCFGTWYLWGPLYGQTIARICGAENSAFPTRWAAARCSRPSR